MSGRRYLRFIITLLLSVTLGQGCCTRELALSVGDAARESFFREQDRLQQRFLQIEADSIKDTVATVRDVLRDEKTRGAVRQLADDFTKAADKSIDATTMRLEKTFTRMDKQLSESVTSLGHTLRTEQQKLSESSAQTFKKFSEDAGETFKNTVENGLRETRKVLAELPKHAGPKVIYGGGCLLGPDRLRAEGITFRQTPYEIKVS